MSKTDYSDWPKRGDRRKQPWEDRDSGITPRHGLPLLVSGGAIGAEPIGQSLFSALAVLGYETPISRGQNPFGTIGPEELSAVTQFRRDHGVREDPEPFGGDNTTGQSVADSHIGPWTGEAILRAAAAKGAPAETPEDELNSLRERVLKLEKASSKPAAKRAVEKASSKPAAKRAAKAKPEPAKV